MSILSIESNVPMFFIILTVLVLIFVLNQPWFTLKSLKKHFTVVNIITGITSLIVIFFIKESGLSFWLINLLKDYIHNIQDCSEYIIASFIGLICRLGLKGLIEDGFKEIFPTYNTMTGTGDINSPENNNSGGIKENTSEDSSSSTSNSTGVQKEESLSDKGKNPEKASDSTTSSSPNTDKVPSNFISKRYVKLFDEQAERISSEIKVISSEINNCKDEEEKALKEEDLEELFGQLTMLSKESAAETRKILSIDSQNSNKRTSDSTVIENSSKKRS